MTSRTGLRLTLLTAGAVLVLLCIPDAAYARGGGGGGRASSGTSRAGPAGRGSVGRTRTRASGRGDLIRDAESGVDSKGERRDHVENPDRKPKPKPKPRRWRRRPSGNSYTVVEFGDLNCTKTERVDGVSYFYCDGAWYEKVIEGGEVMWVEVENPS